MPTIRELQARLPWTIHYHHDFRASPMAHKDFAHALLHVFKAAGKLAAVVNDAEHAGSRFTPAEVDPYVADLVVCAMRMANTRPGRMIDLETAVVERIEGKNGVKFWIDPVLDEVLGMVRAERARQDQQWGGADHDDVHVVADWFEFIQKQMARPWAGPWDDGEDRALARERLVKVAAIAIAAIQSLVRRGRAPAATEETP